MLYYLLISLEPYFGALNVARYITFRTAAASLTALAVSLVLGPWLIRRLREFQIGQVIRQEGPQSHRAKAGTPTMGGIAFVVAAVCGYLAAHVRSGLFFTRTGLIVMATIVGAGAVGLHNLHDEHLAWHVRVACLPD